MPEALLIVEDDGPIRTALARYATAAGFHVTTAATLAEAVARIDGQERVILDLKLPDGDGTELLDRVGKRVRVAVFTGEDGRRVSRAETVLRKTDVEALFRWLAAPSA